MQLRKPGEMQLFESPDGYGAEEEQIDDGRDQRKQQLEQKNMGKSDEAEGAVFRAEESIFVLPDGLQCAEGPAETLADELAGSFRSIGPGDGFFVVGNAPAEAANGDGQVGVFGDGVRGDAAGGLDSGFAPGAESTGDDGDAIEQIESALFHVLAGDVFESLPASEPAGAVADFDVASDGGSFGIGEMAEQLGVGVDGDDDFGFRVGEGQAESGRLSAIDLMNDVHAGILAEIGIEERTGGIGGAVVDHDDAKRLRVRGEHGSDSLHDDAFLVVRGNEYGDGRLGNGHDGVIGAQLFDDGEDADDEGAPADENDAGDENGGDEQAEPVINAENEAIGTRFP